MISNDSDLVLPIKLVQDELHLPVGIYNPHQRYSVQLSKVATFLKQIRAGHLKAAQFADQLTDANGTITKPLNW